VLELAACGLSSKQMARRLGISARTVEDRFSAMRLRTGAKTEGELIAYGVAEGIVTPGSPPPRRRRAARTQDAAQIPRKDASISQGSHSVPDPAVSGTAVTPAGQAGENRPGNQSRNSAPPDPLRDGMRDDRLMSIPPARNSVRIGYARVSPRAQDHQAQLGALAAAHCREVIVETASTRDARPKLHAALGMLRAGDTLVIYKPDRLAGSVKELLVLLEDHLHARGLSLHILSGICAGLHRPDGAAIADKMLFMVAAMAAEMERDLIRERTLDSLHAAQAQGRRGGRPAAANDEVLTIARARRERGESVTAIAKHLGIGRSTLYRALDLDRNSPAPRTARGNTQCGDPVPDQGVPSPARYRQ
jgi:DNA invertase Pin-like site-specific DNA recombinase